MRNDGRAATQVIEIRDEMALITPLFGPDLPSFSRGGGGWVPIADLERDFYVYTG